MKYITIPFIEHLLLRSSISDAQLKKCKEDEAHISATNWTIQALWPLAEITDQSINLAEIDAEFSLSFLENDEEIAQTMVLY